MKSMRLVPNSNLIISRGKAKWCFMWATVLSLGHFTSDMWVRVTDHTAANLWLHEYMKHKSFKQSDLLFVCTWKTIWHVMTSSIYEAAFIHISILLHIYRILADFAFKSFQRWFISSMRCCSNAASSEFPKAFTIFCLFPSMLLKMSLWASISAWMS